MLGGCRPSSGLRLANQILQHRELVGRGVRMLPVRSWVMRRAVMRHSLLISNTPHWWLQSLEFGWIPIDPGAMAVKGAMTMLIRRSS
jgi:hypothetical protein